MLAHVSAAAAVRGPTKVGRHSRGQGAIRGAMGKRRGGERGTDWGLKGAHLLNRWIVLNTGGHHFRSAPPEGRLRGLQQTQQSWETANGMQVYSKTNSEHAETQHSQGSRLFCHRHNSNV